MRELSSHKVNGCNEAIKVTALDGPGPGGASHRYEIEWPDCVVDEPGVGHCGGNTLTIDFQNGPIKEVGTNGVTHEALLAVLIDRLEGFQSGPFANPFNADALLHLRLAQDALLSRTRERLARGVEGTLTV